ncbi:MAG: S-methyl-5-thioribose-1-phosphate isomerase [Ignavibacteriales bacterium]|nr:S-methyl-5-thioribose-1-phosphate isomerase [Ignavibacteriales bacterium]
MRVIEWREGSLRFLDQTRLPLEEIFVTTDDEYVVADAIKRLAIRGAPLIGIGAAYGFVLALNKVTDASKVPAAIERASILLSSTRPTAVNLFRALERMKAEAAAFMSAPLLEFKLHLLEEALAIHREDEAMCRAIGEHGAALLPNAAVVVTHCNTGRLATGGEGTALAVIAKAWELRTLKHVYMDETRPLMQGARLTAWELKQLGIPSTLMTDSTAAFLMQRGLVNAVVVGADRITLNGDVANKVGTYGLAVLAKHHGIPMIVAAPTSTLDFTLVNGSEIPIEQRNGKEVTHIGETRIAPEGVEVYSPAFDITPGELISAIVTEQGVMQYPFRDPIKRLRPGRSRAL